MTLMTCNMRPVEGVNVVGLGGCCRGCGGCFF